MQILDKPNLRLSYNMDQLGNILKIKDTESLARWNINEIKSNDCLDLNEEDTMKKDNPMLHQDTLPD